MGTSLSCKYEDVRVDVAYNYYVKVAGDMPAVVCRTHQPPDGKRLALTHASGSTLHWLSLVFP